MYLKTTLIWYLFYDWDFLYIPECLTNHDCPHCHDHQFQYCSGRYYTCGCEGNIITKDDDRFWNFLKEHCYLAMAQAQHSVNDVLFCLCYTGTSKQQPGPRGHKSYTSSPLVSVSLLQACFWSQSHFYKRDIVQMRLRPKVTSSNWPDFSFDS